MTREVICGGILEVVYSSLVGELHALAARGIQPDAWGLLPEHADLVDRLVDAFGTLGVARSVAGLKRQRVRVDSNEALVEQIRALHDRGARMTPKGLRALGEEMLLKESYSRFGSWRSARLAAGLPVHVRRALDELPSAESILDALRDRAAGRECLAAVDVDSKLAYAARRRFGSVAKAIHAAGITPRKPNHRWTRDRVLAEVRQRLDEDQPVTTSALLREGRADLASAIQRHFGKISAARSIALGSSPSSSSRRRQAGRSPTTRASGAAAKAMQQQVALLVDQFARAFASVVRQETLRLAAGALGEHQPNPLARRRTTR